MFEDTEKIREELGAITAKIRNVLGEDLRNFPMRTAKKRYLALPEFAATLTAEQLHNLKVELSEAAEARTTDILSQLDNDDIWIQDVTPSGSNQAKSLRDNREVTEVLTGIAEITREILGKFGFPDALLDIHYDTPTWFIKGEYLPGLIEKYWKYVAALRQSAREHKRAQHEDDVQMLAERWEKA